MMHLVASLHPGYGAIVDLAAPATWGASAILWAARQRGGHVYLPSPTEEGVAGPPWLGDFTRYLETNDPPQALRSYRAQDRTSGPPMPAILEGEDRPVIVSLAPTSGDARDSIPSLQSIFDADRRAVVLLKPLGLIGEDPAIEGLLAWARAAGLGLTPVRDLAPFLSSSRMAILYRPDDAQVTDLLKRIRRLFTGNFDFLTLAHQAFAQGQSNALLDARLKTLDTRFQARDAEYKALEGQFKALEAHYRAFEADHRAFEARSEALEDHCRVLAERERAVAMHAQAIEEQLISVTSGTRWAAMQKMMWLRLKLFPRGSVRERAARFVMQRQRRLRHWLHSLNSAGLTYGAAGP
jgi:hypothetical protein